MTVRDGFYSDAVLQSLRAAEVPFWIRTEETPAWASMLTSWAPVLLLIGFWLFFMSKFKSGGTNLETARKAVTARLDREEPRVLPAGLSGGAAAALAELRALVRADPPASVLLGGPSGCGKTHLLRALAADLASPCLLAEMPRMASPMISRLRITASCVRESAKKASRPSVV